ncbi:DNA-processing protein DprA [Bifidobacterium sp.]|jgi:DNA processing protein|uniref:DNA-processing protein DprA n=1 Tax=Bifidobacterium sp. TaxID=41200 RepID=UPI0025C6AB48|nr:DNA-processing protein DprA [Bifidobacterium sp.]MCH4209954.1 DNA-protecting protein DprA [Bifidobacterium sp.]MCI1225235.1 DNA-protecting protein DprA [Bifidobacterium sp.]
MNGQTAIMPPDAETLARATLTFCLDGADALMFALLKGAQSAQAVVALLRDSVSGMAQSSLSKTSLSKTGMHARRELESIFSTGIVRWGRSVDRRGMQTFHRALDRWLSRFTQLPGRDPQLLSDWFTMNGSQWIIAPHSEYWPGQLADLSTRKDWAAPLCLWGYGAPSSLVACPKPIAIVGSRGVSEYGRGVAHDIALQAAADGHVVISGGAFGADAAAHWGALEATRHDNVGAGATVAVFAGGLNHIGPQRNERLFEAIVANGGALISELCPGTVPEARRFLLRNRIIAALSSTLVVAQARARSGALNTATWAADLGREVYAVPGDIDSPGNAGCNALIRDGKAIILCSTRHIDEICHKRHGPFNPEAQTMRKEQTEPVMPPDSRTDAEPMMNEEQRRYEAICTAIRCCRRRKLAANPEAIHSMLTGGTAFAQLAETLGEMELLGIIEFDHGVIRIIRQSSSDPRSASSDNHPRSALTAEEAQ